MADDLRKLVGKLDLAQKVRLLTGATLWRLPAEPAIGLRALVVSDGPVGVRGERWDERDTSLVLPSPTALAATWDERLVGELGGVLAAEARRKGVDVLLAPTLNLHRSPLGGRHFECYSEDPGLTGRIGAAYIRGVQAGGVAATAKHYVANDSENERMTLDVAVSERVLHEVYLAPFEAAVEAGVWAVMSSYNGVNGAPMSENPLLAEPLKGAWGFAGPVVSDWGAVHTTVASARSAQDLVMPGPSPVWSDALVAAVRAGEVSEQAIDDKVTRLLWLAERVGALGTAPRVPTVAAPLTLLRRAVAASTVLARNENATLPLAPAGLRRVAVLGWNAANARIQGGGSAGVFPAGVVSPLDGIRAALPAAEVVHAVGAYPTDLPSPVGVSHTRDPRGGEPGVLVRLLDAAGAELSAEHRLSGRIVDPGHARSAAFVEVSATLAPDATGDWRLAVGGWGPVSLSVDGTEVLATDIEVDTDDPATIHLSPAYRTVSVPAVAGTEMLVVARRTVTDATGRATLLAADPPRRGAADELAAATELAAGCDAAIVVVGTTDEIESEGFDRTTLALPGRQDDLVRAVVAANPTTVVVVNSGGPVELPWLADVPAVLLGWFPGEQAGHGLADVLFGAVEPGGRLPTTWPVAQSDAPVLSTDPVDGVLSYDEELNIGYRAWAASGVEPAFWFGHGLGYTSWSYEDISVSEPDSDAFSVRVRLRNTGSRSGREVVQVYLSRSDSAVTRPPRWLAGFTAAVAEPGHVVDVVIPIPSRAVAHWTRDGWTVEPGTVTVHAGPSAGALPLSTTVVL